MYSEGLHVHQTCNIECLYRCNFIDIGNEITQYMIVDTRRITSVRVHKHGHHYINIVVINNATLGITVTHTSVSDI